MRKVLLLDIDYTVLMTDSMIDFMFYAIRKDFKHVGIYIKALFKIFKYILKMESIESVKEQIFKPIEYMEEEDIVDFFENRLMKKINNNMVEVIKEKMNDDYYVIMITASPSFYMQKFKDAGLAHEVIGTEFETENNKYLSRISGKNCKGNEKVIRINKHLTDNDINIDFENSYAYSDSKSDIPMFNLVKHSYLVDKKKGTFKKY